jgi:hypothetical protein
MKPLKSHHILYARFDNLCGAGHAFTQVLNGCMEHEENFFLCRERPLLHDKLMRGRPMILNISRGARVMSGALAAVALALLALPLAAEYVVPSKPFLEKNAFYLRSAGFRIQLADDAAGRRALKALPPHRFVIHARAAGGPRYVYADPGVCNCIFSGTLDNYKSYLDILRQPIPGVADVSPDYKSQASALLMDEPAYFGALDNDDSMADYFRDYL